MQFRLTYQGPLFAVTSRNKHAQHKHEIRKVFHKQLLRFWKTHPYLKDAFHSHPFTGRLRPEQKLFDYHAQHYNSLGYSFVPLITPELNLDCRLDILLLRPVEARQLVISSGDIDNRLKVLFDSLRMPDKKDELGGYDKPNDDEKPFCVLMTDDRLIKHVSVETDSLLESVSEKPNNNDARLVISVKLHPINQGWHNINFGSA